MKAAVLFAGLFWGASFALAFAAGLPAAPQPSDYRQYNDAMARLGQLLFYDRVLSGTYRVSCATCHNHDRASSNGFRLDARADEIGDPLAVNGLPVYDPLKPSPKHAPTLFNLGAKEFKILFSDGRVAEKAGGGFISPAEDGLPNGLQDVLAVQALFPAVTSDELVGSVESDVSSVAHLGNRAVWGALAKRVQSLPDYWPHFKEAYPTLKTAVDISIVEVANSISAFVGTEWRSDGSPFDAHLRGDKSALSHRQKRGMNLFYGKGQCGSCHSGTFQTDHKFHHTSMPVWRFDEDFDTGTGTINSGRSKITNEVSDLFSFRTPSLRNVARTAPYGQAGAYEKLEDAVTHHFDPVSRYIDFLSDRPKLKMSRSALGNTAQFLEGLNDLPKVKLTSDEVGDLITFLHALTDEVSLQGRLGKPKDVPSSLALD